MAPFSENNLIRYSIGNSIAIPSNPNLAFGIYLDNNSHNIAVENNIVVGIGAARILINDASFNNYVKDNLIYDCRKGISFSKWANVDKIYNCIVEGNTIVAIWQGQQVVNLTNWIAPRLEPGHFRNDLYYHSQTSAPFCITSKEFPEPIYLDLSFYQWQRLTGEEGSKAITPPDKQTSDYELFC
ncbi:MAG: right-handed parallel beta-helix repeat-containing protein [Cytophagales bacterium]|nr:right-handed parallel beta-helix repeat-containing protein [Bernardetiaceae bacterium]MDW8210684.1 right-handed parallel beta-helix repeat-containing protein [Cytophagales bacterium]